MIGLDSVWLALAALQDRVLAGPTLDRGTVLSDGSVQLDSDSTPLATLPWVLGAPLLSGQRVLSIAWKGYQAVIGSASMPQVPVGSVTAWAGTGTVPAGWLLCSGATFSSVTYPALAAVLGDTYGAHSGTNYVLPNLMGRVPVGKAASGTFVTLGSTGGEETHVLTTAELASHTHDSSTNLVNATGAGTAAPAAAGSSYGFAYGTAYATTSAGSGSAHNNLQPYITLNYIVKT